MTDLIMKYQEQIRRSEALSADVKQLRAALREAVEYADLLMDQGWGRKHTPGESEEFDALVALVNKENL